MCKADAASYSSRTDLGVGFERAFTAQSVLDDRLRIGLAEFNAGAFEFERRRAPRLVNQACWQLHQFRHPCTGSRAWMPGTRPGMTRGTKTCCLALPRNDEPLLRLRHDTNIGFRRFPALRIDRLPLLVADRTCDDDVFALLPVRRRRDAMLRGHLQRVDHTQDFLEIAPRRHGIDQHQLDLLVRSDRKSTRLNSSHANISYAVFCLKKKTNIRHHSRSSRPSQEC